jgi:uncharacterized protein DUF5677
LAAKVARKPCASSPNRKTFASLNDFGVVGPLPLSIPTDEEYKSALTDLNDLIKGAFQLSVWLTGLKGDTRKRIASILFAKINLCALSITKLLPPDSKSHVAKEMERERFCDVSSVASLCRNLIEASNRLYYFAVEPVTQNEAKMRLKIHEYHAICAHKAIMTFLNLDKERCAELSDELSELKTELKGFSEFEKIPTQVQKRIFAGKQGEALSQPEIAKRRGRNEGTFRADYKYLSSHIHSDAFSLLDLEMGKAGGPMTDETRERLVAMTREATNYLALTLLDMNKLFPQFTMSAQGLVKARSFVERLR